MKIGIIGAGMIGGTATKLFVEAGHEVVISNSRGTAGQSPLVQGAGPSVRAASVEEAASFGEVILVAIPFGQYKTLPVNTLKGKVVIDSMNYYPQRDGHIDFNELTTSEIVAQYLTGAKLVKAFNTMYYQTLAAEGRQQTPTDQRLVIFLAGDEPDAKETVGRLINEIGFAPLDTGSLREGGRKQQPGTAIYNQPVTLYQAQELLGRKE